MRLSVLAAAFVTVGLAAAPAFAQPTTSEAGAHFRKAQAAEKAKRWAEAIEEYERAYDLAPHPDVLFNIGVDQEHLEEWAEAADTFQHYLDDNDHRDGAPAKDADAVKERIKTLRDKAAAKARAAQPEQPPPPDTGHTGTTGGRRVHVTSDGTVVGETTGGSSLGQSGLDQAGLGDGTGASGAGATGAGPGADTTGVVQTGERAFTRWHVAASYGVGLGNEPSERYELRGGIRLAGHLDIDALGGSFGTNDYGVGGMLRLLVSANLPVQPVLIGAATVGLAKQDASSRAGYRVPFGVEGGAGIQFGKHYRLELDAVVRYLANGWGSTDTTAFTYVNDTLAFAIDLGGAVDIPVISGAR